MKKREKGKERRGEKRREKKTAIGIETQLSLLLMRAVVRVFLFFFSSLLIGFIRDYSFEDFIEWDSFFSPE